MKNNFDDRIRKKAVNELFELPEDYEIKLEEILRNLPKKKIRHIRWKGTVVLAAALTLVFSITAAAAVNYVKQRMETLNEVKIKKYFEDTANQLTEADNYSREFSETEKERLAELNNLYINKGIFPKGELKILDDKSEYNAKGVAFLPSYSMYFFPDKEMTDEELLQYIDFMAKREYSFMEIRKKIETGEIKEPDNKIFEENKEVAQKKIIANKENKVIEYRGDMKAEMIAASEKYIYFSETRAGWNNEKSYLYRMKIGEEIPVKLNVKPPENMQFWIITTDVQGRPCVLLMSNDKEYGEKFDYRIWKLDEEGKLLEDIDVTDALNGEIIPTSFAVDSKGKYYFACVLSNYIRTADENGKLLNEIKNKNKKERISFRGVGRGKDGKVYGTILEREGENFVPSIAELDAGSSHIIKKYYNILPEGVGAYETIEAGADSDFLIWGPSGVYSYNVGDEKAKLTLAPYDMPPVMTSKCFLRDGRLFAVEGEYLDWNESKMEFKDLILTRFYYIPAEK